MGIPIVVVVGGGGGGVVGVGDVLVAGGSVFEACDCLSV